MKVSLYAQAGAHCKYHVLLPEIMVSVSIASLVHRFSADTIATVRY